MSHPHQKGEGRPFAVALLPTKDECWRGRLDRMRRGASSSASPRPTMPTTVSASRSVRRLAGRTGENTGSANQSSRVGPGVAIGHARISSRRCMSATIPLTRRICNRMASRAGSRTSARPRLPDCSGASPPRTASSTALASTSTSRGSAGLRSPRPPFLAQNPLQQFLDERALAVSNRFGGGRVARFGRTV